MLCKQEWAGDRLAQPPLLWIPHVYFDKLKKSNESMKVALPGTMVQRNPLSDQQVKNYSKTAAEVQKEPWKMLRAGRYLEAWIHANDKKDSYSPPSLSRFAEEVIPDAAPQWTKIVSPEWSDYAPSPRPPPATISVTYKQTKVIEHKRPQCQNQATGSHHEDQHDDAEQPPLSRRRVHQEDIFDDVVTELGNGMEGVEDYGGGVLGSLGSHSSVSAAAATAAVAAEEARLPPPITDADLGLGEGSSSCRGSGRGRGRGRGRTQKKPAAASGNQQPPAAPGCGDGSGTQENQQLPAAPGGGEGSGTQENQKPPAAPGGGEGSGTQENRQPPAAPAAGEGSGAGKQKKSSNPSWSHEASRSQIQCRTGQKGRGQNFGIPYGPGKLHTTYAEAEKAAKSWLKKQQTIQMQGQQ